MQKSFFPIFLFRLRGAMAAAMLLVFVAFGNGAGWAQSTQGSILGTVKDSSGAVIPGVTVTLTNIDEGVVRTTKSNASGNYQFLDTVPAHYNINASANGFQAWQLAGAPLAARQQLRADIVLSVGGVQQLVQVSGDNASAIETESASINAVYNADDAVNLPTNSRASANGTSGLSLIGTLPGVQTDGNPATYALQGGLPYQTEVSVDGITVESATGGGPLQDALPSTDAISEIRADGVQNNAEFADPGEVTITSKGGSNKIHGSAYWYFQNSALDAVEFGASSKPHKVGNSFGGRFSGPVVIPHLYDGHDKFFIYGGYEGFRFPQSVPEQYTVPTDAMKSGDFTNYSVVNSSGRITPIAGLTDPMTGSSYGTILPTAAISSIAQQFLQFFPSPNHVATAQGSQSVPTTSFVNGETANYYVNKQENERSNQFDIRPDKYFGKDQKFLLWGRFSYKSFPTNSPEPLGFQESSNTDLNRSLTTSLNWTITPRIINEFRFGFLLFQSGQSNPFNGNAFTQGLGLVGLQNLYYNGIPELDFSSGLTSFNADRLVKLTQSRTYVYHDVLTWSKGSHTMKFGEDIQTLEALTPQTFNGSDQYGTFGYSNSGNGVGQFTGVDFADFLIGTPNYTYYDVVGQDNDGKSSHFAFFAQDDWKILPRLTLSYGLRYEYHPGYYDANGSIGNFDPDVPLSGEAIYPKGKQSLLSQSFLASANACDADGVTNNNSATVNGAPCMPVVSNSQAGLPSGLKTVPHLRFMPRFGFAFRPFNDDKTAIRGGFGMYNDNLLGDSFYSLTGTLQSQVAYYQNTYNTTTHAIGYQWPNIYAGVGNSGSTTNYGQDEFVWANDIHWKDPYTEQWSLSVDHDFGAGYAARVSYIGSESHHLVWSPDQNTLPFSTTTSAADQPLSARRFPNWGRLNTRVTSGNSSYHSLQLDANHRFQHGMQFDSALTWAKGLADNQGPDDWNQTGENGGANSTSILDRHVDFGEVAGTRRLAWNTTALYDLPIGRGKLIGSRMSGFMDEIFGGWRLSNIFNWQTGDHLTPYFPAGEGDPSGTGSGLTSSTTGFDPGHRDQKPDDVAGENWKPSHQTRNNWINAAAFTCPGLSSWTPGAPCTTGSGAAGAPLPIGRFGLTQVGSIEGPHFINLNTGLVKTFSINEKLKLRAEGTFTNVLNHLNLDESNLGNTGNNHLNLSSASFGSITAGLPGRTGQVSMRLEF